MTDNSHVAVLHERGDEIDTIVDLVLLNHGVAKVTFARDGRRVTMKLTVTEDSPGVHATLNQWSKH